MHTAKSEATPGGTIEVKETFLNEVTIATAKPERQDGETQVAYLKRLKYREGRLARVRAEALRYLNGK